MCVQTLCCVPPSPSLSPAHPCMFCSLCDVQLSGLFHWQPPSTGACLGPWTGQWETKQIRGTKSFPPVHKGNASTGSLKANMWVKAAEGSWLVNLSQPSGFTVYSVHPVYSFNSGFSAEQLITLHADCGDTQKTSKKNQRELNPADSFSLSHLLASWFGVSLFHNISTLRELK